MKPMDRILVIDDDVELCGLVGEYLEPEGFRSNPFTMENEAWSGP